MLRRDVMPPCVWACCTMLLLLICTALETQAQALSGQVPLSALDEQVVQLPASLLHGQDKCSLLPFLEKSLTGLIQSIFRDYREQCADVDTTQAWIDNNKLRQISNWLLKNHAVPDDEIVGRK